MPSVRVVALPDHLETDALSGAVAVVIDVLRATTTIADALGNNAACVIPVASIDAARMIAHDRPGALLCGERGGIKPERFTLGNSPAEYTAEAVGGRELVLTTTNGTRALHMCDRAHEILTASLTNLASVAQALARRDRDAVLVCSGTDRRVSLEDCICAGLMVGALGESHRPDDSAMLAEHAARGAVARWGSLRDAVASSFHAGRLVELGFGDDVAHASRCSVCPVVPCFDPATGEIRAIAASDGIAAGEVRVESASPPGTTG